jgi:NitT/TauT family transport system ATP-binding protein
MITFKGVCKSFRTGGVDVDVLNGIDLSVEPGAFITILGPSGCGKTTLLNLAAGFISPSDGTIQVKNSSLKGINSDLGLGYMTQDNRLFPWLTLEANVRFPLWVRKLPKEVQRKRVAELVELVGLQGFENHYPYQLSGGMQKRTSLAQVLSYKPDILLMDEPFASLDAQTRMVLQRELVEVWDRIGQTILFVTHDIVEAIALSDRVVVLSPRPGHIKGQLDISLSRPRDLFQIHEQDGYRECYSSLRGLIGSELTDDE